MMDLDAIGWPRHKGGLTIEHNRHDAYYETVEDALGIGRTYDADQFESQEAIAECVRTGSVWSIQWYPDTPVGSFTVCASTLSGALAFAMSVQATADRVRP